MSNNREINGLMEAFRHFDNDGDGKISAYELRSYFGSIGEHMSHEEAEGVIHDLDSDGDNLLDFKDFTKLMKRDVGGDEHDDEGDLRRAFEMFVWEKEEFQSRNEMRIGSRSGIEYYLFFHFASHSSFSLSLRFHGASTFLFLFPIPVLA